MVSKYASSITAPNLNAQAQSATDLTALWNVSLAHSTSLPVASSLSKPRCLLWSEIEIADAV